MTATPAATSPDRHAGGRPYALAWVGLLLLTGTSYGAHFLALGGWATPVALAIAAAKATIVLLVFMHVAKEPPSIRFIAALNALWVALLCCGVAGDVFTR